MIVTFADGICPSVERTVAEGDSPFLLHSKSARFELKKKTPKKQLQITPTPRPTSHQTGQQLLTPDSRRPSSAAMAAKSDFSVFDYPSIVSAVEMNRGKLQLHAQLIDALKQFSTSKSSAADGNRSVGMKTRENVLEQALVEQNQILDIMQELVSTLETENKFSREKINSQAMLIHNLSKPDAAVPPTTTTLPQTTPTAVPAKQGAGPPDDRSLELQRAKSPAARSDDDRTSSTLLSATRMKLEAERIRVIELEEELSSRRDEINKLRNAFSEKRTVIISKESEILHLRHEMGSLRKFGGQQQETVMKLRTALMDKEIQLTSLTRALSKEKKITEQVRRRQVTPNPALPLSKIADSGSAPLPRLFEQVVGREIHAVELTRVSSESELGFSFAKMDLPVSSRVPCLIVKAVRDSGAAYGILKPGDEILEVCGLTCRSADQTKALECLEQTVGVLQMVVARDQEDSSGGLTGGGGGGRYHSTPIQRGGGGGSTTLWATALTELSSLSEPSSPEYITVPEHQAEDSTATTSGRKDGGPNLEDSGDSYDEREISAEVAELQEHLDESEQVRLELGEELDGVRGELDTLQMEFELTKAENFELQQQVGTHEQEMAEIRRHIQELQAALVKLEDQITDDHATIGTLENRNRLVSQELLEAQAKTIAAQKECSESQTELGKMRDSAHRKEKRASQTEEELTVSRDVNDQLKTDNLKKDERITNLKSQLETVRTEHEKRLREEQEQTERLKLELQAVNETSVKTASSAQDEQEQLQVQLKAAKTILMEAEMKESTLAVEMRYLKQAAEQANKQLTEKEELLKRTSDEMASFKHTAETMTLEMETLTLGLRAAQGKIDSKSEMISRQQKDVDGLRRSKAKLQSEKSQLEATRKDLESKLKVTVSEQAHLEEKQAGSSQERDDLFQKLEESISEATMLQQQVEQLNCQLGVAESARKREAELEDKLKELAEAKSTMEEESHQKVEILKVEKSLVDNELARLRGDVAAVRETSQSSSGRLQELQKELSAQREALLTSEGDRVSLAHNCDGLKKREIEHQEEVKLLKSDNNGLQETLERLQAEHSSTRKEMEIIQKRNESSSQQLAKLRDDVKALEISSGETRRALQEHKVEAEASNKTRQEQKLEIQDLENQLSEVCIDLDDKQQEAEDFRTNFEEVSNQLAAERTRESEGKIAHAELESKLTQLKAAKRQSDDMVASLEFMQGQNQAKIEELTESLRTKTEGLRRISEAASEEQQQLQRSRTQSMRLTDNVGSLKEKLKTKERETAGEIASLREKLSSSEAELQSAKIELEASKKNSSKQAEAILQWKRSLEHSNEERYKLQKTVDDSSRQKQLLEARSSELATQLTNTHTEIEHLKSSNDALSSETARLRQQLKQSGRETDEMSANVLALEMNLGVAKKGLDESMQQQTEWTRKVKGLESQVADASSKLEQSMANTQKVTLELHGRDEQISKLKASLDLRQKESSELQQSLLTVQSSAATFEKKSQALEGEKKDLTATIEQLRECQNGLKSSLLELESEKEKAVKEWRTKAEELETEVERLELKEKAQSEEVTTLERAWREAQSTVEQMQAAQDALKQSINTLGDQREIEMMRMGERVMELEGQLSTAQKELSKTRTTEEELRDKSSKLEKQVREGSDRCELLSDENTALKREVEMSRETEQKLTDLHSKLTALEEGLRTKNRRLEELERNSQTMESDLKQTQKENETLLTEITEIASLKLAQAEKSAEIDRLSSELASQAKTHAEVTSERDQLLTMLRKLEVEKHTEVVQQPTPKLARGGVEEQDPAKLVALLKDKEEEAFRLREYVGKLLSNVVEKAPFILENMQ